ncbi:hypothetical protein Q73_00425 [Bacillus coahuilensis m2-6]|nr:hypothetical protein Q73_00425 [Bacillus coahuilensis m2-6]
MRFLAEVARGVSAFLVFWVELVVFRLEFWRGRIFFLWRLVGDTLRLGEGGLRLEALNSRLEALDTRQNLTYLCFPFPTWWRGRHDSQFPAIHLSSALSSPPAPQKVSLTSFSLNLTPTNRKKQKQILLLLFPPSLFFYIKIKYPTNTIARVYMIG